MFETDLHAHHLLVQCFAQEGDGMAKGGSHSMPA